MKQEDKELLLRDLCARLLYGVKVRAFIGEKSEDDEILGCVHIFNCYSHDCKPYLRPMLSMTEEEKKEFESFGWRVDELDDNYPWAHNGEIENVLLGLDWLNAHHFDYRGLIEKGLALEAPKGMYN